MIKLSLCMIVKNEESNLRNSLNSVCKFADEIIIVDTGSSDNTISIAKEFTEKVFHYNWCNDFSKARNFSVEKASNDWVLILDADEEVTEFNKKSVMEYIQNNEHLVGRINRINLINNKGENAYYRERINRVFNRNNYRYEGNIHEQVSPITSIEIKTIDVPIEIRHIGYIDTVVSETSKLKRNISLLKEALKQNENDPYIYYQLGKSYYMKKEYDEANKYFYNSLIYLDNFFFEYALDMITTYGYSLLNSGDIRKAENILQFEKYYKSSVDFIFLKASILMNLERFKESAEAFILCTTMDEGGIDGINSYKAYYNIGVIFECLNFRKEAIQYYKLCDGYNLAQKRLSELES